MLRALTVRVLPTYISRLKFKVRVCFLACNNNAKLSPWRIHNPQALVLLYIYFSFLSTWNNLNQCGYFFQWIAATEKTVSVEYRTVMQPVWQISYTLSVQLVINIPQSKKTMKYFWKFQPTLLSLMKGAVCLVLKPFDLILWKRK